MGTILTETTTETKEDPCGDRELKRKEDPWSMAHEEQRALATKSEHDHVLRLEGNQSREGVFVSKPPVNPGANLKLLISNLCTYSKTTDEKGRDRDGPLEIYWNLQCSCKWQIGIKTPSLDDLSVNGQKHMGYISFKLYMSLTIKHKKVLGAIGLLGLYEIWKQSSD